MNLQKKLDKVKEMYKKDILGVTHFRAYNGECWHEEPSQFVRVDDIHVILEGQRFIVLLDDKFEVLSTIDKSDNDKDKKLLHFVLDNHYIYNGGYD